MHNPSPNVTDPVSSFQTVAGGAAAKDAAPYCPTSNARYRVRHDYQDGLPEPADRSPCLAAMSQVRKIYQYPDMRFGGALAEDWTLHLRQFEYTCDDFDIPAGDRVKFLVHTLKGGALHFLVVIIDSANDTAN